MKDSGVCSTLINSYSYHYDELLCFSKLEKALFSFTMEMNKDFSKDIIYLCIGTDRATGDCLGPLVGTRLKTLSPLAHIFGTLENPTHATNLVHTIDYIEKTFNKPLIIAVDASLGKADRIGFINVKRGGLKPGTALKKVLPEVGDFHISGVVNVAGFLEQIVLQNTRLYTVYAMANIIAKSLHLANYRYERFKRESIQVCK
ncbi:MAG TPA: spore protease YyaC [Syntrophomonadaceae bacterium]|nr:spore protease YyaC [Syntrophomonadaceae bacterium]